MPWALLCAEILYATVHDKTMSAFLKKVNADGLKYVLLSALL
ncbi:hypothetical protein [Pseudomonas mucidolens]|nr:hypothetical protein [Pseudomonas mucidolens]